MSLRDGSVEPDLSPLDELRARLDELAGRVVEPDTAPLEELRARLDELAGRVVEPDLSPLDDLLVRVDELAGRVLEPDTGPIDALHESVKRLQELAAAAVPDEVVAALEARVAESSRLPRGCRQKIFAPTSSAWPRARWSSASCSCRCSPPRVDEIATSIPPEHEMLVTALGASTRTSRPARRKITGCERASTSCRSRLEDLTEVLEPAVANLQSSLTGCSNSVRAEDAAATGARLADLTDAVD